ncbi:MAG: TetR/AcrR family transcriptional regulator [Candidatus Nanopelagicales bacterium]
MHGEHNRAARELLEAARAELRDVGQAAFTMDAVARRAYYSPGAIYQRWPDRVSLLGDVGREVLADLEGALAGVGDAEASISFALDDGRDLLGLVSEILIAGHTSTDIRDVSLAMWSALRTAMGRHLPPGMAWYLSIVGLGDAMLASIDIAAPLPVGPRIRWMLDACDVEAMGLHVPRPGALTQADVPAVPQPARSDPTTLALIQAAQSLLAEQGAESLSTRRVSAQAGVTTGAIYRRYDGKGALLADVLLVALAPDRYEWTWELVAALASDDPYWAAADVMTAQLLAASRNEAEQRVLLQIGVAARTDTALRAQIQERVRVASEARCAMCDHLGKAGVIRADIDPAVLAWGFQSEPVGLRAIIPLGIPVDEEAATLSMRAALTAAAAR